MGSSSPEAELGQSPGVPGRVFLLEETPGNLDAGESQDPIRQPVQMRIHGHQFKATASKRFQDTGWLCPGSPRGAGDAQSSSGTEGHGCPGLADGCVLRMRRLSRAAREQCTCWEESGLGSRLLGVRGTR